MKKVLSICLILIMAMGLMSGCGSGGTASDSGSTASDNVSSDNSTAPDTASSDSAASGKKELVYAQSIAITSLDPAGMQPQGYPSGYEAAFAIFNGLIRFDEDLGFQPDLAESWSTSNDGLVWTFHLREGVKFHDGTDFNADAVVKQYTRMIDNTINLGAYSLWEPISKIEKEDDYTVKITTKTPYSAFLNVMAHGSALIPSPDAVEKSGDNFGLEPVGTGPYKLESIQPGTELILVRNDNYYEGTPQYEKITFRYVGDASARVSALKSGQADVIDSVPIELAGELAEDENINLISKPGLQVFGVGLNQKNEILQDKTVRQALNYAIDKDAIAKSLFMGYVTPLTSPLAKNTTGSTELEIYASDVEKAKNLLEDDGWVVGDDGVREKDGKRLSFTMILPDGMYSKDVTLSETIQNQLKGVGVEVTLNKVESSTYWDQLKVPKASTDYDMALWGYNPSHGNGQIHMESLFTSNPDESQVPGLWNFIWYQNDKVDELLAAAKTQVDADEYAESMKQAQEIVWEECPYIWLHSNNIISAAVKDVENITVLPVVFTLVHRVQ